MYKRILYTTIICLLADQISKYYLVDIYHIAENEFQVTSFFNMVMVWNYGISFGMFSDGNYSSYIFALLSTTIIIILLLWFRNNNSTLNSYALGFIIGGALGNVIDRFHYGAVADFFDFHINNLHWPAFNIADTTIFIGACMLLIDSFKDNKTSEAEKCES